MIRAIFFDFNGVIIDDEALQLKAYQQILAGYDVELTEEHYLQALGMDDRTFARVALERGGKLSDELLEKVLAEKVVIHRKMIEKELPLFPGVVNFIKSVARHFSLGVVSMADQNEIGYVVDRARLRDLFTVIVTADEVHVCKPAPDCYATALNLLNQKRQEERKLPLLAKECLAIEDSPAGIQAARGAGMRALGVTNTVTEELLRAAGADAVTTSLADWNPDAVRHVFV